MNMRKNTNQQPLDRTDNKSQQQDLLRTEVLGAFDRASFERDGYWVWEEILTDLGRRKLTSSLQKLQQMNDRILMDTDWARINFKERGLEPPPCTQITQEFLASCCGASEQMPAFLRGEIRRYMLEHGLIDSIPTLVTHGFESMGVMPEYFPAGYDDFVIEIITAHPQMMELFRKLLGNRFLLDHCIMLNRGPGKKGRYWHGHPYRQGQHEIQDAIGDGSAVSREFLKQQCVRTLCYPEGATIKDGGELAVIPGAHLYRIPYKWNTERPDDDAAMELGWLKGKTHPITGEPLAILHLSLSPGSMVSFVHHMPHYVSVRQPDAPIRWGLLMAYRTPDPSENPAKWNEAVPVPWAERIASDGRLSALASRVFEGDNPIVM